MPLSMPRQAGRELYPAPRTLIKRPDTLGLFAHLSEKEKRITAAVFPPLPGLAVFLLPPVSVGPRRGAEASLTGVWVLITDVCALISGPQLPASSLLHASEWGYISLSL